MMINAAMASTSIAPKHPPHAIKPNSVFTNVSSLLVIVADFVSERTGASVGNGTGVSVGGRVAVTFGVDVGVGGLGVTTLIVPFCGRTVNFFP